MQQNWEDLAHAVILQAVEDYRHAQRLLRLSSRSRLGKSMKRDVLRFFCSRWFTRLATGAPRGVVVRMLLQEDREAEAARLKWRSQRKRADPV